MTDITKLHLHWRVSRHKGNVYRSYSLARAYRKDGKNRKEIVFKLGKLADEEAENWRNLLRTLKKRDSFFTTFDDILVVSRYAYLDVSAAHNVWDFWKLDEAFGEDGKRDVAVSAVARILSVNRCIDPVCKSKTPEWFKKTVLPWLLDIEPGSLNPSRVFRELEAIENRKEKICQHLFERIRLLEPESMESVFYDLSSTTFSGSRCVIMKWGHCKEGFKNHVVLAIVVNREGLPFYWEVLPGGTADATTIEWLPGRLKERFENIDTTLVFDRGMVSEENLAMLEESGIKYISAMDRNQIETLAGLDFSAFSRFDPEKIERQADEMEDFEKLNETTYYREIKVEGKRRYILCFNPQLFKDQHKSRKQSMENFKSFVSDLNGELLSAKKSRQRKATYNKFKSGIGKFKLKNLVDVDLKIERVRGKIRTYQGTVKVDEKGLKQARRLDGFWLLVTNHTEKRDGSFKMTPEQTIRPYREKVVIESAFRDIKSFVEVEPVFVWKETHVKAHYTVCVLSHLINRTLSLRLHDQKGRLTKDIVSHERLFEKLSECMIDRISIENLDKEVYKATRLTEEQKELIARIGMNRLLSRDLQGKLNNGA
jgi:transposase